MLFVLPVWHCCSLVIMLCYGVRILVRIGVIILLMKQVYSSVSLPFGSIFPHIRLFGAVIFIFIIHIFHILVVNGVVAVCSTLRKVIFVLFHKDEMIVKGIIPKDVKWDLLTKEQEENVKKFIEEKIESQKRKEKVEK